MVRVLQADKGGGRAKTISVYKQMDATPKSIGRSQNEAFVGFGALRRRRFCRPYPDAHPQADAYCKGNYDASLDEQADAAQVLQQLEARKSEVHRLRKFF